MAMDRLIAAYSTAWFGWRSAFYVPGVLAVLCAVYLLLRLRDTPQSVGLPPVEEYRCDYPKQGGRDREEELGTRDLLVNYVLTNRFLWIFAIANFFVYTLRYAVFDWGPTLLKETKHIEIKHAAWMLAGFEVCGALGALVAGWLTDRFFGGRAMRASVFFMVLATVSLLLFWKVAGDSRAMNSILLCSCGFFIYGPQCLVGIAAANLATKRAAASAVGLTGLFGYASTLLSGWGLGTLVQQYGWDAGFTGLIGVAIIGTIIFIFGWPAKAHGYKTPNSNIQTPEKLQIPTVKTDATSDG